ncbi:MAG TPA: hypothetical protein VLF88_01245 [Candidatus Babeliales bacterium]|nr:hypothetical protein [Candidatus Babeliales bacterium]
MSVGETSQGKLPEAFRKGDGKDELIELARGVINRIPEGEPVDRIEIPFEDPELCMRLSSGVWVDHPGGGEVRSHDLIAEWLETELGLTVSLVASSMRPEAEGGAINPVLVVVLEDAQGRFR